MRICLARTLAASRLCVLACFFLASTSQGNAADVSYPQLLHLRYEAIDQKAGGNFIIWLEREKFWHGLDSRLYPAATYVDITHLTPMPGSPLISIIEVGSVNSKNAEFYHVTGVVRFKITGMTLRSTNATK